MSNGHMACSFPEFDILPVTDVGGRSSATMPSLNLISVKLLDVLDQTDHEMVRSVSNKAIREHLCTRIRTRALVVLTQAIQLRR
jgi:hypothetical protein